MRRYYLSILYLLCILGIAKSNLGASHSIFPSATGAHAQFKWYRFNYLSDWTARLDSGQTGPARQEYSDQGEAFIVVDSAQVRAEIQIVLDSLKSFTRYSFTVKYASESSLALLSLHPQGQRRFMDLDFLPPGTRQINLELHTGSTAGPYILGAGLVGPGKLKIESVSIQAIGPYQASGATALIIDLLSLKLDPDALQRWKNIYKLKHLYGFEYIEVIHPLNISTRKIARLAPDLIVFSPLAELPDQKPSWLTMWRLKRGIRKGIDYASQYDIPVLGICAGHQSVAQAQGGFLAKLKDDVSGEYLYELGPTDLRVVSDDAIYKGLPRDTLFTMTEAHKVLVHRGFTLPEELAVSDEFDMQILRYDQEQGSPAWYTFQGHIEKDWEYAAPEAKILFDNLLTSWGFIRKGKLVN